MKCKSVNFFNSLFLGSACLICCAVPLSGASLNKSEFLGQDTPDSTKLQHYFSQAAKLRRISNDSAIFYGHQALSLAKKMRSSKKVALAARKLAGTFEYQFDSLYFYERLAIDIAKSIPDYSILGHSYLNLAFAFEAANSTSGRENISNTNAISLFYADSAIIYFEKIHDTSELIETLSRKGEILMYLGRMQESGETFEKAMALHVASGKEDHWALFGMRGEYHYKMNQFSTALFYQNKALEICKKEKNLWGASYFYAQTAMTYARMGKFGPAINHALRGLTIANENNFTKEKFDNITALYEIYKLKKDFRKALVLYEKIFHQTDSLHSKQFEASLSRFNAQLDAEKNKEKIALLQKDKEVQMQIASRQRIILFSLIGGLLLFIILVLVIYNRYQLKQRALKQSELAQEKLQKQKELAEQLRARAEESERIEQQFLANMSHEIRTPMNAVMGMTRLLLNTPISMKQRFYLEGIKKSSDNLLYIINDILDYSKIEAGKMDLEKIDMSIKSLVKQVRQTLQHKADEKGLELVAEIQSGIDDVVLGDPVRLNQVLINLAGNAIKFTNKGSITIQVSKDQEKNGTCFSIIDTGIGIPEDKIETVFESFTQANASDTRIHGGTGLGLSISRMLIHLMGGEVHIRSKVGSGTTFSFTVPLEKGSKEKLEQRIAAEEHVDGSILDDLSILIVDDNEYNRVVAKDTLESKSDAEVMAVSSGQEAIQLLKEKHFDLVLMDVQMPIMNGFEATRYIRANFSPPVKNIPIIALTASVLRTDLDRCKEAGMDSYISKPFRSADLIREIASVLNLGLKVKEEKKNEADNPISHSDSVSNLDYLHKFCEGDQERMKKYIIMFTSTAPALANKIRESLEGADYEELANQIHSFKTKWIMMGMVETKDLAMEIEHQCRNGKVVEQIKILCEKLIRDIEMSLQELKS